MRGMSRRLSLAVGSLLVWSGVAGCTVATPFRAIERPPPQADAAPAAAQAPVIVALTYAELDPARRAPFDEHLKQVVASLDEQPGRIGYSLCRELFGNKVWTMTAWADETSRAMFEYASVHQRAIEASRSAILKTRFARVTVKASELPLPWKRALEALDASASGTAQAPAAP